MIAVVLGLEYAVAVVAAPDGGVVARAASRGSFRWRVIVEDRLAAWWRADELTGAAPRSTVASQASALERLFDRLADLVLWSTGRVARGAAGWGLPARGRREADMVVRSHRLWEAWLGRHAELPLDHLHPPAEWIEHHLGADLPRRIEAEVGLRTSDPHGRTIPAEPRPGG